MTGLRTVFTPLRAFTWQAIKGWVRQSFPAVQTISTAELADWLGQDSQPVLIDARRPAEYAISHLPQAIQANSVEAVEAAAIPKDEPIVIYCSVGYRSARLGHQLQAAGYQVMNLEGSLFQWANEGRSLRAAAGPTRQVHPYNPLWGMLLDPSAVAVAK
ncbi:MAG: rhodanese-like domain-containing protein [Phormidesmis sp.]